MKLAAPLYRRRSGLRRVSADVRSDHRQRGDAVADPSPVLRWPRLSYRCHRNHGDRIPTEEGVTAETSVRTVLHTEPREASSNLSSLPPSSSQLYLELLSRLETCTCRSVFRFVIKQVKIQQTGREEAETGYFCSRIPAEVRFRRPSRCTCAAALPPRSPPYPSAPPASLAGATTLTTLRLSAGLRSER